MNELEQYAATARKAWVQFLGVLFGGYILITIIVARIFDDMGTACIASLIVWVIIFFGFLFKNFSVYVEGYTVTILTDAFNKEKMYTTIDEAIKNNQVHVGIRPCKRGWNPKLISESILDTIDLKAHPVTDRGEEATWTTEDNQLVFVDDEFFVSVVPETAVINYSYRANGMDMNKILEYCRGKTETFKELYIKDKTMDWLRNNPDKFDKAFKDFIDTNPGLQEAVRKFGVRITGASIFEVMLTKAVKDANLEAAQAERGQLAVDKVKAKNPDLTQMQANQLSLAERGLATISFQIRDENVSFSGIPDNLVTFVHNPSGDPTDGTKPGNKPPGKK